MRIHEILQNSSHMQSTAGNVERPTISDCDVLVKLVANAGAKNAAFALNKYWFCRYPYPLKVTSRLRQGGCRDEYQERLQAYLGG
jgi:hypothetical protein